MDPTRTQSQASTSTSITLTTCSSGIASTFSTDASNSGGLFDVPEDSVVASTSDDDMVGLPAKSINQIIKDTLGETRLANDCRETVHACCVSFIREVSRHAQSLSANEQRKTITQEHVVGALNQMQLPSDYTQAANSVLEECQEQAHRRLKRKNSRLENCGIPEEELYRQQQELIEKARRQQEALDAAAQEQFRIALEQAAKMSASSDQTVAVQPTNSVGGGIDDDYDAE